MQDMSPIIKVQVEGIKAGILYHLGVVGSEYGDYVEAAIDKALETYPWKSEIEMEVHKAIKAAIEEYFSFGEGAKAIKEAVERGVREKH